MTDIIYIKPDAFDPAHTPEIAREIGKINAALLEEGRKYLLIGPGRWGSADHWLGIPVTWSQISGVGAMVEAADPRLVVEPSQCSHFFHNITTPSINYITISDGKDDFIDWDRLQSLATVAETPHAVHVRLDQSMTLKVDGRMSHCVVYE